MNAVKQLQSQIQSPPSYHAPLLLIVTLLVYSWGVLTLIVPQTRFVIIAPPLAVGIETTIALSLLFGAWIFALFPSETLGRRLRWVAAALALLGITALNVGVLQQVAGPHTVVHTDMILYLWLGARTAAGLLCVVGLFPANAPRFAGSGLLASVALIGVFDIALMTKPDLFPPLTLAPFPELAIARGESPPHLLTGWYLGLSLIPLALGMIVALALARRSVSDTKSYWLAIAMMLLAGSQFHALWWPSAYTSAVTSADLLRLCFALVVKGASIFELRSVAAQRAALLVRVQQQTQRLHEAAALKADFTAMVAHELISPITAIRGLAGMLATRQLDQSTQEQIVATIRTEADALTTLVADVAATAQAERDTFSISQEPTPIESLLAEAALFGQTLPGAHPIHVESVPNILVLVDAERIKQVLRNLLSNAAKYSSDGTPITLKAYASEQTVRVAVQDEGQGIHPEDIERIFEKFGRGRDLTGRRVAGMGFGLYLSRQIVRAHGSDLTVHSEPGVGTLFTFELEIAR